MTLLTEKRCIVESVHNNEAAEVCNTYTCWESNLLTLRTWCWFLFCRRLAACDIFAMEFHGTAHVIENVQNSAFSHTESAHTIPMHFRQHSITVCAWGDIPHQCTAQTLCIYFACSVCDRHSQGIAQTSLSHQFCIKCNIQYIPRNMHTVFALLCFVVVIHWPIFPYPSGLLHWHFGNLTIAPVPAKQPWWIWINTSCEIIMNDYITTTKQSTTKPCAYFLGYTVN